MCMVCNMQPYLKTFMRWAPVLRMGLNTAIIFLSVLIANCADEMAGFLKKKVGIKHIEVGVHDGEDPITHRQTQNYAASVYLRRSAGNLLFVV